MKFFLNYYCFLFQELLEYSDQSEELNDESDSVEEVKCKESHICKKVYGLPDGYMDHHMVYCRECGRKNLDELPDGFYHCRECQYDICRVCTLGVTIF